MEKVNVFGKGVFFFSMEVDKREDGMELLEAENNVNRFVLADLKKLEIVTPKGIVNLEVHDADIEWEEAFNEDNTQHSWIEREGRTKHLKIADDALTKNIKVNDDGEIVL